MNQNTTPSPQSAGFLDPQKMVREVFKLKNGDFVADFGCGHGYFTIALAHAVGKDGKVYALDIQKLVLDSIRTKAKLENFLTIEPIHADLEQDRGSKIKDGFVDCVVIGNVLFQAEHKDIMLREAYRILRSSGRLIIIEWVNNNGNRVGPPQELRLSKEQVITLCENASFAFDAEFDAGSHHYGLLFIKKAS